MLGAFDPSTGVDTSVRPGESVYDYAARIGREQADYLKFLEAQKAGGQAISARPPGMRAPQAPQAPPPKPPMSTTTKIVVVAGVAALAYFLLIKK